MRKLYILFLLATSLSHFAYPRYYKHQESPEHAHSALSPNPFLKPNTQEKYVQPDWATHSVPKSFASLVQQWEHPEIAQAFGSELPKAVFIQGEPGTGKTTAIKAATDHLKFPLAITVGSDFISRYFGEGAKVLEDKFYELQEACDEEGKVGIFVIDECDTLTAPRTEEDKQGNRNTLSKLLTLIDGLENNNVIVVFMSNMEMKNMDNALLRRIRKHVKFTLPDEQERANILAQYFSQIKLKPSDLPNLTTEYARKTNKFAPADLEQIARNAADAAAYEWQTNPKRLKLEDTFISKSHIQKAFELVKEKKSATKKEKNNKNNNTFIQRQTFSR